ncbi:hypothetical protein AAAC51_39305 [Priestia megaterium]
MAGGDNYEKLINFLVSIANITVEILMSILIIAYSFQSVMMLFPEKILIENEFYLTYIEKYIDMANKLALIGPPVFNTLFVFGAGLLAVSCCVWKILNLIGKGLNLPFFRCFFDKYLFNFDIMVKFIMVFTMGCQFVTKIFYFQLTRKHIANIVNMFNA